LDLSWCVLCSRCPPVFPYPTLFRSLFEELAVAHGDGRYVKFITQLAKVDVLLLDDWGVATLTDSARRDLLEILDDRYNQRSTIRSEEHTSELQSRENLVCRLLLEKK